MSGTWYLTEVVGALGGDPARLDPPREMTPELWQRVTEMTSGGILAAYHLELKHAPPPS